ncbi:putative murein peptide carboxypeptidase [Planctomycetes bacterium MalM25]|nr:putative murein peptide carboxypeptidase [Planctomycetes bacterium MalM25]
MQLTRPPALKPGDAISVVAPASSPRREACDRALEALARAGYTPKVYRDFCQPHGYLAGVDAERVDELEQAFRDPDTSAVLAVRGGYGVGRILDRIDFGLLTERPKIVCGYSDITALHAAIQRRCGMISFHGPNLMSGLGDTDDDTQAERDAALDLFTGRRGEGADLLSGAATPATLTGGVAEGRLVGGNLAVMMSLLGTPDQPDFYGAILLLEDTGEVPYRVDRLLNQLRMSGLLQRIAGAVLGYFSNAESRRGPSVDEVLGEFFEPLGVPVITGAPIGHEHPNLTAPLGARVRLDADGSRLLLDEAVVSL